MRLLPIVVIAAGLAACVDQRAVYAPPQPRRQAAIVPVAARGHFIHMNAPDAASYIVKGVLPELGDNTWRWCLKDVELKFRVPDNRAVRLRVELAVADETFKGTGPVRVAVLIDGKLLDTITFDRSGSRMHEKEVPPEMLPAEREVSVRLLADKDFPITDDGTRRAFILVSAGFLQ